MAMSGGGATSDDAVRREASDWVALIHDQDAAVDRAAFERWRTADPRHASAFARAERAWDSAALLDQTSFGRARGLPARQRLLDRPQVRYAFAAAAVLVVAILGLSFGGIRWTGANQAAQPTELASSIGQIRKVALPDGSTVTLDTNSALHVAFNGAARRLYLSRGRARFDVAHDATRPFVVMAGSGSVTARGTIFDVAIGGNGVKVVLLRGIVDVRSAKSRSATAKPVMARLRTGQQISFDATTPLPPQPAAASDEQWTNGMLSFDRTRLADALAEANRYSTTPIRLADPALQDLRITGAYRAGDTAGLARSIAGSFALRVDRAPGGGIVLFERRSEPAN